LLCFLAGLGRVELPGDKVRSGGIRIGRNAWGGQLQSFGGVLRSMLAVTVAAVTAYAFTFATVSVRSSDPDSPGAGLTEADVAAVYADADSDQAGTPAPGVRLVSLETDVTTGSIPKEALAMAPMTSDGSFSDDRFGGPLSSFEERFGIPRRIPKAQIDAAAPIPRDAPKRTNSRVAMLPSPSNPLPVAPGSGAPALSKAMPPAGANREEIWASHGAKTAIYDISAKIVYMPNGEKLEAHSGLGEHMDDLRSVNLRMKGVTPPNVYELTERERLFHGVRAVRLNPVDRDRMFGRAGMLVHSYMLGPNGDSNGCISVKDYPKFLNAFLNGEVERMVVVDRLGDSPGSEIGVAWLVKSVASAMGMR
jgi:hypothetical protein